MLTAMTAMRAGGVDGSSEVDRDERRYRAQLRLTGQHKQERGGRDSTRSRCGDEDNSATRRRCHVR